MDKSTENPELLKGVSDEPNPDTSQKDQEPSSPADAKTLEVALQRIKKLEGDLKGLQSIADTGMVGVNKEIRKQVSDLQEQLKVYEKYRESMPADKAYREMMIDEMIAERNPDTKNKSIASESLSGKQTQEPGVDMAAVAKAMGLDTNSADYTEAVRSSANPAEQILAMAELTARRARSSQIKPASEMVMQTQTGGATSTTDVDALTARLEQMNNDPNMDREEFAKVKADLIKAISNK